MSEQQSVLAEAYAMLESVTPTEENCGELCDRRCCLFENGNDLVTHLLPGEDKIIPVDWCEPETLPAEDADIPEDWFGGDLHYIQCDGLCNRKHRPILCRSFPLQPHLDDQGKLLLLVDVFVPYECPLIAEEGSLCSPPGRKLRKDFIHAVYQAWSVLLRDPQIRCLVEYDSQSRGLTAPELETLRVAAIE